MKIENVEMMGLESAVKASKYPMLVDTNNATNKITKTVKGLGSCDGGTAHDSFLKGIVIQYDLTCNHVMLPQFMRYHFHDIVSSQSKMHRISKMDLHNSCDQYVRPDVIEIAQEEIDKYLSMKLNKEDRCDIKKQYEVVMSNLPMGLELTMRVTSNYLQLKSIYHQRKGHRMSFWKDYCDWVENLPFFRELVLNE